MFFLSSALYPLWKIGESSEFLVQLCHLNPFTYAVELIRFSLYGKFNEISFLICIVATLFFATIAIWGYDPTRGLLRGKR